MCLDISDYLRRLGAVFLDLIANFSLRGTPRADATGIWVGDRLLGAFGVAVHDWVSHFGAYVNIHPALDAFRGVHTVPGCEPMTSLERERHGPVRPALVRQRLVEHFEVRFGFTRTALFTDHPSLEGDARRCDVTRRARAGCG
jgi:lipoate-protein ligase B